MTGDVIAELRAFVSARIDDDERAALAARGGEWWAADEPGTVPLVGAEDGGAVAVCGQIDVEPRWRNAQHVARHSGNRVLRQCAQFRKMVDGVDKFLEPHPGQPCTNAETRQGPCYLHVDATGRLTPETLPLLAAIWNTHADYDAAWADLTFGLRQRRETPASAVVRIAGPAYTYTGTVTAVHDGDTFTADVDLGLYVHHITDVRLLGCNAIELANPGGVAARDNLAGLILGQPIYLHTVAPDKYGRRWDAQVTLANDSTDVVALLIVQGWAAPWDGKGPKPAPVWPRVATPPASRS